MKITFQMKRIGEIFILHYFLNIDNLIIIYSKAMEKKNWARDSRPIKPIMTRVVPTIVIGMLAA